MPRITFHSHSYAKFEVVDREGNGHDVEADHVEISEEGGAWFWLTGAATHYFCHPLSVTRLQDEIEEE